MPLRQASPELQNTISSIVREIINRKAIDCERLEKDLNDKVYKIFGLTSEEIKIIEEPAK